MKLVNPTDDWLDSAFAEKIAGWRPLYTLSDLSPERWAFPDCPPEFNFYALPVEPPSFTTSFDLVLPWLEKYEWVDINREHDNPLRQWTVAIAKARERSSLFYGQSRTLSKAAVLAILLSHDVEVEFTEIMGQEEIDESSDSITGAGDK